MTFTSLGLTEPLLRAISDLDYKKPTPVQLQAIPAVLSGRDVIAVAQTGTGKTASFVLPLLKCLDACPKVKANHIRGLILAPTRELAIQISEAVASCGKYLSLKTAVVYGGVSINPQMMKLRGGADILVATPGRMLDLYDKNALKFSQVNFLILDEADRMFSMGFSDELHRILRLLPKRRQTLLFSATFSNPIRELSALHLKNPIMIEINQTDNHSKTVQHQAYEVDKEMKSALLSHMIRAHLWEKALVFTRTKNSADNLHKKITRDGISAAVIHGDKSQGVRQKALENFKTNKTNILIATDLAARGLDIEELPLVINYELPQNAEIYIHRIGRTGRAGLKGKAISLVCADEIKFLASIEALISQPLLREVNKNFIPKVKVPSTDRRLNGQKEV